MGTTVLLALVRAIQGLRTLLTCPKARKPEGRKSRLGCNAPVGQVPGLVTLQAQAFTDSSLMWVQAMGPTVLQKSQQVPTTGSPGPSECPSMTLPSSPYPHEKTQILVGSGELARGDPPRPLEEARCPWLPVMEAREQGQTAGKRKALLVFVCLGTEEDEASKPQAQETGWPSGESVEPDCLGSSRIKSARCLLVVSCGLHDQGSYDTPSESLP